MCDKGGKGSATNTGGHSMGHPPVPNGAGQGHARSHGGKKSAGK